MKVSELLAERHQNWSELQRLCAMMEGRSKRSLSAAMVSRFSVLYRAACADLALADAYQLPPNTVQYLHQIVGRAHNQLYRGGWFRFGEVLRELLYRVPQRLFKDNYLRVAFVIFFGFFVASYFLARHEPGFAKAMIGEEQMEVLQKMYANPMGSQDRWLFDSGDAMGGYVSHNAGIGLRCFAAGVLLCGVGGMFAITFNACFLGAVFGYMDRTPQAINFNEFVTAHGPFELTAIVLSAAAGMRLGFSYVDTGGLTRLASLKQAGRETMPTAAAAVLLFVAAAFIEGYISPTGIHWNWKATIAIVSAGLMLFYFVMLGMPKSMPRPIPVGAGSWDAAVAQEEARTEARTKDRE